MYIYLISNNLQKFKIGISKDPDRRIKELQTGNDSNLFIINKYYSPKYHRKIEKALHKTYGYCNILNEWFELENDKALSFIVDCQKIESTLIYLEENKI